MTITFLPSEPAAAGSATAEHLHSIHRLHVDLAGGNGTVAAFQGNFVRGVQPKGLSNEKFEPNAPLHLND